MVVEPLLEDLDGLLRQVAAALPRRRSSSPEERVVRRRLVGARGVGPLAACGRRDGVRTRTGEYTYEK